MPRLGLGYLLRDEQLKEPGHDLPQEFALFPPIILDVISTDWLSEVGSGPPARYNSAVFDERGRKNHCEQV